jgi:hypothetical protein
MNESHELPILQVLHVSDEFSTGSNRPLLVRAVNEKDGKRADCVLKPNGGERMGKEAMLRELAATFLAKAWGIQVVEPLLLRVTPELVKASEGQAWHELLSKSLGLNYGSVYLRNYQTPALGQAFNHLEFEQAQAIFAFDLFIQNVDRRRQKPNLMSNGEKVVVYDHELAFSFTRLLFPAMHPWELKLEDWVLDMFLYPIVKGKPVQENQVAAHLEKSGASFWDGLAVWLPGDLSALEEYAKIRQFCTAIASHPEQFIHHLKIISA